MGRFITGAGYAGTIGGKAIAEIDAEAKAKLDAHVAAMKAAGHTVWQRELPEGCKAGHFVAPTIIDRLYKAWLWQK